MSHSNETTNTRSASKSIGMTVEQMFEAYEALPAPLRTVLQESNLNWASTLVLEFYHQYGLPLVIRMLENNEWYEIKQFAQCNWPEQYGEYPFLAAKGTIQRYNARSY